MIKNFLFLFAAMLISSSHIQAQGKKEAKKTQESPVNSKPWEVTELYKTVKKVEPARSADGSQQVPGDAVVLFDGTDFNMWQKPKSKIVASMTEFERVIPGMQSTYRSDPVGWKIIDQQVMEVVPGQGPIASKQAFGDVQLHIEWLAPVAKGKEGQGYSNSGVFFMGLYEVQILNSYDNDTYANGQASAVYKQHIPLVNASLPPDTWQTYDIIFMAPRFSDKGSLISPARLTVIHNGVLVQNNVELLGPTCFIGTPYYIPHPDKLPLILQDHGDPIRFRNIWVREL